MAVLFEQYCYIYNFLLFLAVTTSRGKPKKVPAKEVAKPPKEAKIKKQKEQNAAIQEDNSKTKNNIKTTKKGNAKKAAPRGKLNAAAGKVDEAQAEEVDATPEVDVKENGETHMAELKPKKKTVGKANAAMNGKVEVKGKQKKGQAAAESIDEKEVIKDVIAETETTERNVTSEIEENDSGDISLNKDDSILELKDEEDKFNDSKVDSIKSESNVSDTSVKETERSGTFLCF